MNSINWIRIKILELNEKELRNTVKKLEKRIIEDKPEPLLYRLIPTISDTETRLEKRTKELEKTQNKLEELRSNY